MPSTTLSPRSMTVGKLGLLAGSGRTKPFSSVLILYCCCTSEESRALTYQSGGVLTISVDCGNSLSRIILGMSAPSRRTPSDKAAAWDGTLRAAVRATYCKSFDLRDRTWRKVCPCAGHSGPTSLDFAD